MSRPALEVADIFRDHGAAWRKANAGHVSVGQMKVMSAIERCRTPALGGRPTGGGSIFELTTSYSQEGQSLRQAKIVNNFP
jgi:hypothetical protein